MRSFGDSNNKEELPTRTDYLPFRFIDPNSPKNRLQRMLEPETIELCSKLIAEAKIPPKVLRTLYQVEGFKELLEEF